MRGGKNVRRNGNLCIERTENAFNGMRNWAKRSAEHIRSMCQLKSHLSLAQATRNLILSILLLSVWQTTALDEQWHKAHIINHVCNTFSYSSLQVIPCTLVDVY
jgi:hypothetical protein